MFSGGDIWEARGQERKVRRPHKQLPLGRGRDHPGGEAEVQAADGVRGGGRRSRVGAVGCGAVVGIDC